MSSRSVLPRKASFVRRVPCHVYSLSLGTETHRWMYTPKDQPIIIDRMHKRLDQSSETSCKGI